MHLFTVFNVFVDSFLYFGLSYDNLSSYSVRRYSLDETDRSAHPGSAEVVVKPITSSNEFPRWAQSGPGPWAQQMNGPNWPSNPKAFGSTQWLRRQPWQGGTRGKRFRCTVALKAPWVSHFEHSCLKGIHGQQGRARSGFKGSQCECTVTSSAAPL